MKPWMKITLGVLLSASVIAFIIVWDVYIKDKIDSVEVLVVKPGIEIQPHTVVDESMLAIDKRQKASLIPNVILPSELDAIVGQEVKHNLIGNMMLSKDFVDYENLTPNPANKEAVYPIPNEWIYTLPSTLRRKDRIDIYLVSEVETKKDENGNIITRSSQGALSLKQINTLAESDSLSDARKEELIKLGAIPALVDVPIIYAKDSGGNEITTASNEGSPLKSTDEDRFYSSGMVSNLELLLTETEYRTLLQLVKDGNKFYITYN